MARDFNGSTDVITCSDGALSGMAYGSAVSVCFYAAAAAEQRTFTLHNSPTTRIALGINIDGTYKFQTTGGNRTSPDTLTANHWVLIAGTKATGSVTPRLHSYDYLTGVWNHGDAINGAAADATASSTALIHGATGTPSNFFTSAIAVSAAWKNVVLTDTQIETLAHSLRAWFALNPTAMWIFDQADPAQKLLDMTGGGANESARTGTSVSALSAPIGYGGRVRHVTRPAASAPSLLTQFAHYYRSRRAS